MYDHDHSPAEDSFRTDVLRGLSTPNKRLASKYLYDNTGSKLFEQICDLPEYYLTRTEFGIMRRHAREMAQGLGPDCLLIEYGSGSGSKTRILLDELPTPAAYVPVDIARKQLLDAAAALSADYPTLEVKPVCADFTQDFALPEIRRRPRRRAVYFPGSTIGNLTPDEAHALLVRTARLCGRGGAMLLGADLKKDRNVLEAAYNDRAGVTAAFNLNLLSRINRELGAQFVLEQFSHRALFNEDESRIEMHLVSRRDQRVLVAGREIAFAHGESICTEYSYKHSLENLRAITRSAGFVAANTWLDERGYFCVMYLTVE
jgi:L-histidine N-alpha-methyltransferase